MFWKIVVLVLVASTSANHLADFEAVKSGMRDYLATKRASNAFLQATKTYQLHHLFREDADETALAFVPKEVCTLCNVFVDGVLLERAMGASASLLATEAKFLCRLFGIENQRVCDGTIDLNIDTFVYIMDHTEGLDGKRMCGVIFQSIGCEGNPDDFQWATDVASGTSVNRPELNTTSSGNFQILQLSDIHYDPRYTPGGNANCGEPLCCQDDQTPASSPSETCGYWSDYRDADSPWHLVEETVRQTNTHEFEYVYYTGDIIGHRVWSTSVQNNTRDIGQLMDYFRDNYKVPVYPVFGNHEPSPLNVWTSEGVEDKSVSTQWIFSLAAEKWSTWLGNETKATILRGGYYSVSPRKGFRIIGINSNICYTVNWWLIHHDVDPFGQLQWLADTLKQAEDDNESVHILSHVPTGQTSCLKVWSQNYHKIIERFANTITGQFNGHTHKDEFHVYYSPTDTTRAIGAAFNGASVTPFTNANPSYKLYDIDRSTYTVANYEEWTFNLTLANSRPPTQTPEWYKLYSFTEAYGAANCRAEEVGKVVERMAVNHTLLEKYHVFKFRNGDAGIAGGCDRTCQRLELCSITTSQVGDATQCDHYGSIFDNNV